MEKGLKVVTIGGGSSYTPELIEGFILRYHELPIKELWLVDIEDGLKFRNRLQQNGYSQPRSFLPLSFDK